MSSYECSSKDCDVTLAGLLGADAGMSTGRSAADPQWRDEVRAFNRLAQPEHRPARHRSIQSGLCASAGRTVSTSNVRLDQEILCLRVLSAVQVGQ
jgi:hypothetical protein